MTRIAKKSRTVKGQKGQKASPVTVKRGQSKTTQSRYTIRKDSLDRRYAIDKRTGKRVSLFKAEKERAKRQQAAVTKRSVRKPKKPVEIFRGITPPKKAKPKKAAVQRQKRSAAAKKGWETRRARAQKIPVPIAPLIPEVPDFTISLGIESLIPEGLKVHVFDGVAERAEAYPKIGKAAYKGWLKLQLEKVEREEAIALSLIPPPIVTPRFDRLYGKGHGEYVRSGYYMHCRDLYDLDEVTHALAAMGDNDYSLRELYTLYFSPELA
jgi:hypothetical protein